MHRVIGEPNGSENRGCFYTIQVTKIGSIITNHVKHIHAMPISTEHYLCKQLRKTTGQAEGMKAIPTETDHPGSRYRVPVWKLHKAESKHL